MNRNRIGSVLLYVLIAAVAVVGYAAQSPDNGRAKSSSQSQPPDAAATQSKTPAPAQSSEASPQPANSGNQAQQNNAQNKADSAPRKPADLPFDRPPAMQPTLHR